MDLPKLLAELFIGVGLDIFYWGVLLDFNKDAGMETCLDYVSWELKSVPESNPNAPSRVLMPTVSRWGCVETFWKPSLSSLKEARYKTLSSGSCSEDSLAWTGLSSASGSRESKPEALSPHSLQKERWKEDL